MSLWLLVFPALAGEHKPLCTKSLEADLIIEVSFTQKAVYPPQHRTNEWAPPEEELIKTAKTGVVTHVFKGKASKGDAWKPAWGVRFNPGATDVKSWDQFFQLKHFKEIYFLRQSGDRFTSTGWAEESAGCGASDHRSWCPNYTEFQKKIQSCLDEAN
jgi:hypothetical protein